MKKRQRGVKEKKLKKRARTESKHKPLESTSANSADADQGGCQIIITADADETSKEQQGCSGTTNSNSEENDRDTKRLKQEEDTDTRLHVTVPLSNGIPAQQQQQPHDVNTTHPQIVKMTSAFENATPTYTHLAITRLMETGMAQYCITQNVDGLHRRAGLERHKLAILHGCVFTETCELCHEEYFRDFDVGGMSFQTTGRYCENRKHDQAHPPCGGALRDTVLDWEDALPEHEFELATDHCTKADLAICLGTSLRIEPAGSLPTLAKQYVIINLQITPKDDQATLVIRAKVDDVMKDLLTRMNIDIEDH
jgi:NAD-dependent SIR2 family protein deacetylase